MPPEPFLARTEEQETFKRVLDSLLPGVRADHDSPFVILLYGEAGMGKSTLAKRLREIAEKWQPYESEFNTLFVDWEIARQNHKSLQVGHDDIHPEAVLDVLHDEFIRSKLVTKFSEYDGICETLRKADEKIQRELNKNPEDSKFAQVRAGGAALVARVIRVAAAATAQNPMLLTEIPQQPTEDAVRTIADVSYEVATQAWKLGKQALESREFKIYAQPHEYLAEALGAGIAELAKHKPLVIFLDTYEVIDRDECDYSIRKVIRRSGDSVVWVIAGRRNLAESEQLGDVYFNSYRQSFPDARLYAKKLGEFGLQDIQAYFREVAPARELDANGAEQIARFTLGIPFAISEAAAMWRDSTSLEDIVAPVAIGGQTAHARVVRAMTERFFKHCKLSDADRATIYALALVRRPDAELLRAMLDTRDLEITLQSLHARYSFVWVETMRLDEKLAAFLREDLLAEVRRTGPRVQEPNTRAITFLRERLEKWTKELPTAEARLSESRVAEAMSDLTHHLFWTSEDDGWRYLIPRFVEGLEYDSEWAPGLLEIAEKFRIAFSKDAIRRLKVLSAGASRETSKDAVRSMLDELETLGQHKWLDGDGGDERATILLSLHGLFLFVEERYKDALQELLEAEKKLPADCVELRKDLAEGLRRIGWKFALKQSIAAPSPEAENAFSKAVELDKENGYNLVGLGVAEYGLKKHEQAAQHLKNGIAFLNEGERAYALNWLGNVLSDDAARRDEAEKTYRAAIALDPKYVEAHNNLGNLLAEDTTRLQEAEAEYRVAIALDPKYANPHNGLGALLAKDARRQKEAEAEYRVAIALDPKVAAAHNNLGSLLADDTTRLKEAEEEYRTAIALDPKLAQAHNNLGSLLADDRTRLKEAEEEYRAAIALDPKLAQAHNNLGSLLADDTTRLKEAEEEYRTAIALDSNCTPAYTNIMILLRLNSREEEALPFIEKWMQIDPQNFDPPLALASIHKKHGHPEESTKFAAQARSLIKPDDWYNLACLESVCGNVDIAIEHLRRAAQSDEFDRDRTKRDPDLEWIRDDPRFTEIVKV